MQLVTGLLLLFTSLFIVVLLSLVVEFLRTEPEPPKTLFWSDIPISYVEVEGLRLRFIKTGQGPVLVLLHTLRTQFDIFYKVIPDLARNFTVYTFDYPGHGYSDIPETDYVPELFISAVEEFINELKLEHVCLAGISIGGSIALQIAAKHNPRINRVVAINPYDYGRGRGIERGNLVAWLVLTLARIPVAGETIMRYRIRLVEKVIMQGGVTDTNTLSPELLEEIWKTGTRKNHYRGFINLIRNAHLWESIRNKYRNITIPVLLVYGEHDWSYQQERQQNIDEIPGVEVELVDKGGHFLTIDRPDEVSRLIRNFAG